MRTPPFLPFLPNTPRMYCADARILRYARPHGKNGKKANQGEIDNEKRNHNHRPRGRARRPHQHAMPAVQTLPPMPVPAVPTVPVPTAAAMASMASMAVASAVAADAGLVLTRTIAPRRVRTTGRLPARGARKRAKYREIRPFPPESGGMGGDGCGEPPLGRVLPSAPSQGRRPEGVAPWGRVGFRGRTFFSSHFHGEGDTCRSP